MSNYWVTPALLCRLAIVDAGRRGFNGVFEATVPNSDCQLWPNDLDICARLQVASEGSSDQIPPGALFSHKESYNGQEAIAYTTTDGVYVRLVATPTWDETPLEELA